MGKILHQALENNHFAPQEKKFWDYEPQVIVENETTSLFWNRSVLTDRSLPHNRPDSILWHKKEKTVHLIDYAVVNSHNIMKTYSEKLERYVDLSMEIKEMWGVETVKIHPIIISTTGVVPKTLSTHLKELNLPTRLIPQMQHSVILSVCNLFRKTLN